MPNYTDLNLKRSESVSTPEEELNTIWTHFIVRLKNMIHFLNHEKGNKISDYSLQMTCLKNIPQ